MALDFKISRSGRWFLTICLIALLAVELIDAFLPETMALAWHVRHGFKVRCCGLEVPVPTRYLGGEDYYSVSLFNNPGYVRSKFFQSPYGMMQLSELPSIQTHQDDKNLEIGMARATAMYESSGYKLVHKRTTRIADNQMECWEFYTEHFDRLGPQFKVMCHGRANDLAADFTGSPSMLKEFYSTLESTRPASRE